MLALPELKRLAGVLARLGSDHAGERDAAALAASRLVDKAGVTWLDLLIGNSPEPQASRPGWATPPVTDHTPDVRFCQRHSGSLSVWELGFLSNLAVLRTVTDRQRATLAAIVAKVRSAGPRAG